MKNKLKLILVGILSLALVTGCSMKTNIHMDIKANKDVTISMTMAMDDELIDAMISSSDSSDEGTGSNSSVTDKQRWEYVEKSLSESEDKGDWTKEKYDKDGFKGYTYISKTLKLDDLTGKSNSKYDFFGDEELDKAKIFTKKGSVYKSNFSGDMKKDSSLGSNSSYASSMDLFEVTFSVTLPNKPAKHNATSVSKDGKTLTWDLTKESDIQFEFSMGPNYLLYGGIAALVVVVIAVVSIVSKSAGKKKDKSTDTQDSDKPMAQSTEENQELELNNDTFEEPKEDSALQAMYNEPQPEPQEEVKEEVKTEDSLQDMYNADVPAAEESTPEQSVEESVLEQPTEQPVIEQPTEQPVEENKE